MYKLQIIPDIGNASLLGCIGDYHIHRYQQGQLMPQALALIKRRADITRQAFADHYEKVHAPLAIKLCPLFSGYMRNHITSALPNDEPGFDAIVKFSYDSFEEMMTAAKFFDSEEGKAIKKDELTFMEPENNISFMVEERCPESVLPQTEIEKTYPCAVKLMVVVKNLAVKDYQERYLPNLIIGSHGLIQAIHYDSLTGDKSKDDDIATISELWFERDDDALSAIDQYKVLDLNFIAAFVKPYESKLDG